MRAPAPLLMGGLVAWTPAWPGRRGPDSSSAPSQCRLGSVLVRAKPGVDINPGVSCGPLALGAHTSGPSGLSGGLTLGIVPRSQAPGPSRENGVSSSETGGPRQHAPQCGREASRRQGTGAHSGRRVSSLSAFQTAWSAPAGLPAGFCRDSAASGSQAELARCLSSAGEA